MKILNALKALNLLKNVKFYLSTFLCLLVLLPSLAFAQSFFETHSDGWFWYQDFPLELKTPRNPPQNPSNDLSNPTQTMHELRQKVEDSLNLAILSPTSENLRNYAAHYFAVISKGQRFVDAYKVMALNYPQYDYSLKFPTNHLAQPIHIAEQLKIRTHKIHQFSKTHGFFFFLASGCPYCHAFSPIVKQFTEKYNISVVPITLDGGVLPEFPDAVPDNGSAKALKVYSLPSLFAVNPSTQKIIPVANGALSLSELEENILKIMAVQHE
jgi:conjugal transfer pilus assembly protein TraF